MLQVLNILWNYVVMDDFSKITETLDTFSRGCQMTKNLRVRSYKYYTKD